MNDAALFVRWRTRGVLWATGRATMPSSVRRSAARRGERAPAPREPVPAAPARERPGLPRATDNVTAFAVSSTLPSTMAPSSIVVPKVWVSPTCPFADFRRSAFSSTQFQKASLSFRKGGRSSSAARIAGGFYFETS